MSEQTGAEALVRRLDEAHRELDRIEGVRRELRLGRQVGRTPRTGRFMLLRGVWGNGWFSAAKDEPIRIGSDLEVEFYAFTSDRLDEAGRRVDDLRAQLSRLGQAMP